MPEIIICKKNALKLVTTFNLAFAVLASANAPAQALQFNFTYAPDTRQEVIDGFKQAGNFWSSQLKDTYVNPTCRCNTQTTVNISINYGQLSNANALSGTRPRMVRLSYQDYLTQAFQDITSASDLLAFQNLQIGSNNKSIIGSILQGKTLSQVNLNDIKKLNRNSVQLASSQFSMLVNTSSRLTFDNAQNLKYIGSNAVVDNNGNDNNQKIWLTSANAKAFNLIPGNNKGFDAQIMISNSMLTNTGDFIKDSIWDFSRVYNPELKKVDANKYDFVSAAAHEIGHALGFVSGVDAFDILTSVAANSGSNPITDKDLTYVSPLDLFRYSDDSKQNKVFDWSKGGNKYFSIDGGATDLANFDGNNYQGSHWQAANNVSSMLGVMNPTLKKGNVLSISNLDLQLLDVIGWDLNSKFVDQTGLKLHKNIKVDITSSLFDNAITRSTSTSKATGIRYWQNMDDKYMEASQYTETQHIEDPSVENASLDQLFDVDHDHDHEQQTSVPEPNAIAALSLIGLWGIGRLFKRHRK
ncbi:matrixin family metalloprotease [Nostoc sp. FACHB-152]|uniref:NF038122 family metalloprotease n=1 Tax=unclassified Nostoc TaxID=2593658 RepID=UPI00168494EF|nr:MULTISPECIES: NF038122 family metalloprotease [unclassified Nostoc]MBD2446993.1 matrixin family metalloprotease [Nostoc sp. FACHB-152]MBD2467670.1 matrixin family metalloprotease [Nostoc sp. FACHB-145]